MPHPTSNTKATIAVLTVSDTRTTETDSSGAMIVHLLEEVGHSVASRVIVKDESGEITNAVQRWVEDECIEVIVITGGTGPSRKDITPEVLQPMFSATMPGFGELFRQLSFEEIGSASILSRALAGWIDIHDYRKPVFILPGSTNAVTLALSKIIIPQLGHLLDLCRMETVQ